MLDLFVCTIATDLKNIQLIKGTTENTDYHFFAAFKTIEGH